MMSDTLSFLTGANAEYISNLYASYLRSPDSVDAGWQDFFKELEDSHAGLLREILGPSWTPPYNRKDPYLFARGDGREEVSPVVSSPAYAEGVGCAAVRQEAMDSVRALMLIRAYRVRGHLIANLDPLGLKETSYHPELDPAHYGFGDDDYDRPIFVDGVIGYETATLRQILEVLRATYCGTIGVEFMHLTDPAEKSWIQERIEGPRNHTDFTLRGKRAILERITAAESFEKFLHTKYVGTKRFGLDGGESLIPCIEQIMKRGGQMGLQEIVVGMAHRGRLNVLTNVMGKPFEAVFAEFQGNSLMPDDVQGSGDVKYHLGASSDRTFDDNVIHLSLTSNPSHLEFVNPVVIGKVRAKQVQRGDKTGTAVLPLLLHGDAAFAGQGIVAETLMISELPGYRVGGTIHIVINNQIGFTTMPKFSRSGHYCTDVAKMLSAPIFHVNGDDPESVVHVARIATEFRQTFKRDVVIDMFCYRRYGHNEGDEPSFTQPLMYKRIKDLRTTREIYAEQLVREQVVNEKDVADIWEETQRNLEGAFREANTFKPSKRGYLEGRWSGMKRAHGEDRRGNTALVLDRAKELGKVISGIPENFAANTKIVRLFEAKNKMFQTGEGIDWATAEALAFASLLDEGHPVRLSGQDVGRGTFSQRHAILYDQETEEKYIPLKHVRDEQPMFEVHDSPLSELAVLGFEYGYSLSDPSALVLWEAQFGDFANGAQVMIDQFLSSAESKWLRMSGLVLLLPHGMEGQGPEHSSARPERFLQLSAEDNWQIANCTTPANYFHILRRQIRRDFRKPLVIMTPKSLLRHKLAVSSLADFSQGSCFHRVLLDDDHFSLAQAKDIRRVVLCSGKVYYDLLQTRRDRGIKDVLLLRVEQLYPFPHKTLAEILAGYPNAQVIWCQEEPRNQGYWSFMDRRIENVLLEVGNNRISTRPFYIGRPDAVAPATGLHSRHITEQEKLVSEALAV